MKSTARSTHVPSHRSLVCSGTRRKLDGGRRSGLARSPATTFGSIWSVVLYIGAAILGGACLLISILMIGAVLLLLTPEASLLP